MAACDRSYGKMKNDVADELDKHDCQKISTFLNWPRGVREKTTDGLSMLNMMEARAIFWETNVDELIKTLTELKMEKAANIVTGYNECKNDSRNGNVAGAPPDYSKHHMDTLVPDSKLSELSRCIGCNYKPFAIEKLGLSDVDLEQCAYMKTSLPDVVFCVLSCWKNRVGTRATYKNLVKLMFEFKFGATIWKLLETPADQ